MGGQRGLLGWLGRSWPFWLAAVASVIVFSSGLRGGFVYDDSSLIVSNEPIRQPRLLAKALVSDTWAFQAGGNASYSAYWRPCATLWMAAGYQAFGLRSTLGWHLANLALHLGVLAAALTVLRRL